MPSRRSSPEGDIVRGMLALLLLGGIWLYVNRQTTVAQWPAFVWVGGGLACVAALGLLVLGMVWIKQRRQQQANDLVAQFQRLEVSRQRDHLKFRRLVDLDPTEFEKVVGLLFTDRGYEVVHTGRTGDNGVDLRLRKDGLTWIAQCKRYTDRAVSVDEMRDFYGTLTHEGADHGFFVTTSRFTGPAREFARHKPITLIDKTQLQDWIA